MNDSVLFPSFLVYWIICIGLLILFGKKYFSQKYRDEVLKSRDTNSTEYPKRYHAVYLCAAFVFLIVGSVSVALAAGRLRPLISELVKAFDPQLYGTGNSSWIGVYLALMFAPTLVWLLFKLILIRFPKFDQFKSLKVLNNGRQAKIKTRNPNDLWQDTLMKYNARSLTVYEWKLLLLFFLFSNCICIPFMLVTVYWLVPQ